MSLTLIPLLLKVEKELYHFHKDHMVSFKIWSNEKLPAEGYNCFSSSLGYTQDVSKFAFGFCSPRTAIPNEERNLLLH